MHVYIILEGRKIFLVHLSLILSQIFVTTHIMKPLSAKTKSDIISRIQQGKSVEKAAAELGVGRSTVSKIKNISFPHRSSLKPGRKKILSPTVERSIVRAICSGRHGTASQVQKDLTNNLGIKVSQTTVRRCLIRHGLRFERCGNEMFFILDTVDRPTPSSAATFSTDLPCCNREMISLFFLAESGFMMWSVTKICDKMKDKCIKNILIPSKIL